MGIRTPRPSGRTVCPALYLNGAGALFHCNNVVCSKSLFNLVPLPPRVLHFRFNS